ncbi:MAG: DegV family protein [Blautia sp.]|nr:DegV family protein [Blautia sp.]
MPDYVLSCCSTADLSKKHFNRSDIRYICFHCTLGGTEYPDDLGESLPPAELYRRMVAGEEAKASQVSAGDYEAFFEESLKAGKDILHVTLSTGISGTYNSACVARDELRERYPERKIHIVDSLGASSGYGLDYSGKCYLSHSECLEDAKAVAALVEERFQKLDGKVEIFPIGATIGSHTGPGTIALFFWGDERKS